MNVRVWGTGLSIHHPYRLTEVGAKQGPGLLPTLALNETA